MLMKLLVEGGEMKPGPAISQKLGPLGIPVGKVIQNVNEATKGFKGMKVPVELDVDVKSKSFKINVYSPPVAELIKKEIENEKGSGDHKKIKVGNLAIEQVIKIAKTKHPNMLSKSLKSAIKSVVGSCISLGVIIENKNPKEIEVEIEQGKYDKEINSEKTEISDDKRKNLKEYFDNVKKKQEEVIKKEEEVKKLEEEQKQAQATTTPTATGKEVKESEAPKKEMSLKKEKAGQTKKA